MTDPQPTMPIHSDAPMDAARAAETHANRISAGRPQSQPAERQPVRCSTCRSVVFDGLVIKARVVRVLRTGAEAKCRCKTWVPVPVTYWE